jgi:hypothetical protein
LKRNSKIKEETKEIPLYGVFKQSMLGISECTTNLHSKIAYNGSDYG